ncbi:hypothetical protein RCH33_246 [Flavobacterium daejeonense]|nr:hypothetical protein RCH33_246 [Flavobacterium daejeonense]
MNILIQADKKVRALMHVMHACSFTKDTRFLAALLKMPIQLEYLPGLL